MKKVLFAMFVACTLLSACASSDDKAAATEKTRSNAVEQLPAEDK